MKQGWEIKKLGEVCSLIADGDWIESRHQSDDGIRLIQTGNIGNGVFRAKDDKPHYISESTFVELGCTEIFAGDCLVSRLPDPVGRACIIPETNCRMITAVDCSIIRFNSDIVSKFFIYYTQCEKYRRDIDNNTTGTTRKRISRKNLESICIPIPPREEQERIVAELDCLSGVIEKKREQLRELDALAQSIFYQMFGDPITNEKRWEVKKLGEVCEDKKKILRASKKCALEDVINYIDISAIDNINNVINIPTPYIFEDAPSRAQQVVQLGDVIVSMVRPNLKNIAIVNCNYDNLIASSGFCVLRVRKEMTIPFLFYIVKSDAFTMYLMDRVSGANYPAVRESDITDYISIVPPITLQQEFAEKIEAIEKQKELIKKSISETETLFNSRMDYYFN